MCRFINDRGEFVERDNKFWFDVLGFFVVQAVGGTDGLECLILSKHENLIIGYNEKLFPEFLLEEFSIWIVVLDLAGFSDLMYSHNLNNNQVKYLRES